MCASVCVCLHRLKLGLKCRSDYSKSWVNGCCCFCSIPCHTFSKSVEHKCPTGSFFDSEKITTKMIKRKTKILAKMILLVFHQCFLHECVCACVRCSLSYSLSVYACLCASIFHNWIILGLRLVRIPIHKKYLVRYISCLINSWTNTHAYEDKKKERDIHTD